MPRTRWLKISYALTKPPLVTQSSAKCGYQMRSQKPEDIWFRTSKRAVVGVVTITGPEALPAETAALLPLCPAAAVAVAVAPASAKQKNGWRCSSRSMHEWCEDVHYWKLLSIIEQVICVLIQLPSSYYSFWRAHEWIIAISVKLVVAAAAAVQPAHEWWREQTSYWRAIRCLLYT